MKELKDLKPGDIIKVQYGNELRLAKVIENRPEHKKLFISVTVGYVLFVPVVNREVVRYSERYRLWPSLPPKE